MASHGRRSGRGDRSRGAGGCGRRRARRRSGCGAPSTMGDIDAMTNRGGGGGRSTAPPSRCSPGREDERRHYQPGRGGA